MKMKTRFCALFGQRHPQSGQAAVLMLSTFTLVVVLGAGAFGTDLASYYYNAFILQSAVDASVLSGAKYLPCQSSGAGTDNATSVATTIGADDWLESSELSGQPTFSNTGAAPPCQGGVSGYNTIKMTATRTVPFYFGRAVGVNQGNVSVCAAAQVGALGTARNPFQVAIQVCGDPSVATCSSSHYTVGETLSLLNGGTAPGNWGPISYTGNTVSLCTSGTGCIRAVTVCKAANDAADAAQALIDEANSMGEGSETASSHSANNPRAVVVPLVDWSSESGPSQTLNVYGFAEVWINSVVTGSDCSGGNPQISATFISQVNGGSIDTTGTAFDVGSFAIRQINC
jgi:hypothetical protein